MVCFLLCFQQLQSLASHFTFTSLILCFLTCEVGVKVILSSHASSKNLGDEQLGHTGKCLIATEAMFKRQKALSLDLAAHTEKGEGI